MMPDIIIPTIGAKGIYTLKDPFTNDPIPGEEYTCQAIRKLSDYIANNEDPYELIYSPKGITEDLYKADLEDDMYVVSLQSESGQWILVPASYLQAYPFTNGVRYRTMMIGLSIGAIPFDMDLGPIMDTLKNVVAEGLGITPEAKAIETSRPIMISRERHDAIVETRRARATMALTDAGKLMALQREHEIALQKLQLLEAHIKSLINL